MLSPWQSDRTIIDRVHIRTRSIDPLRDQRRIGALLERAALRPKRLSAASILCVRKFRDPLPGANWLAPTHVCIPMQWEEAAAERLDQLVSAAARPALGPVSASAEAVLFLDRAEMLMCMAMDWAQGKMRENWWWAELLRHCEPDLVVMREWATSPEYVPAALEMMAARGTAAGFLHRVPEDTTTRLLGEISRTFAVPEMSGGNWNGPAGVPSEDKVEDGDEAEEQQRMATVEPWVAWAPEAVLSMLHPLQCSLLGQALTLRRAPSQARSKAFQTRVARWLAAALRRRPVFMPENDVAAERNPASPNPEAVALVEAKRVDGIDRRFPQNANSYSEAHSPPAYEASDQARAHPAAGIAQNSVGLELDATGCSMEIDSAAPESAKAGVDPAGRLDSPTTQEATVDNPADLCTGVAQDRMVSGFEAPEFCTAIESDLGGVFFLLNVALHLKFYGDFTSPHYEGLELNIWDFVSLIGRALAGDGWRNDRVWAFLDRLAGREEESEPGGVFEPPENWRIPEEWLEAFPEEFRWEEVIRDGRVGVWHPAGFLLMDTARTAPADRGARLEQWTRWIVLFVRARLIRALGRDDASNLLIRNPARITATATHVQVHYSLDRHPIEIRMAGLDRDPGWIPAAGRYIAFHFG